MRIGRSVLLHNGHGKLCPININTPDLPPQHLPPPPPPGYSRAQARSRSDIHTHTHTHSNKRKKKKKKKEYRRGLGVDWLFLSPLLCLAHPQLLPQHPPPGTLTCDDWRTPWMLAPRLRMPPPPPMLLLPLLPPPPPPRCARRSKAAARRSSRARGDHKVETNVETRLTMPHKKSVAFCRGPLCATMVPMCMHGVGVGGREWGGGTQTWG